MNAVGDLWKSARRFINNSLHTELLQAWVFSSLRSLSSFASIPGKPKDSKTFEKKPREWVQAFTIHIKLCLQQLTNTWRSQRTQL
jgi:hypothetical protein